jgi:multicomponent Na+:H+ antiporter subunit E
VLAVGPLGRLLVVRPVAFVGLWLVLNEGEARNGGFAVVAVVAATVLSHRLFPARGRAGIRPWGALRLGWLFATQSISGGFDVARRAFDPRLPVHPGMVEIDLDAEDLPTQVGLAALVSLLPGTMCVRLDAGMRVHSLDTTTDVTHRVARAERAVAGALGPQRDQDRHGRPPDR